MRRSDKLVLGTYRKLLKLYPPSYRQDYESEMTDTMAAMLLDAEDYLEKFELLTRAVKDYVVSLMHQNVLSLENTALESPTYIRQSSMFSTSLVIPFFMICSYNWLNEYILHHQIPYAQLEAKTWIIYCIVLPAMAGAVLALASIKSLISNIKSHRNIVSEWLPLGLPLILLITFVLM